MFMRALAPHFINLSFELHRRFGYVLSGDLAITINRRLRAQGKPILTWKEAICLASYTTHLEEELPRIADSGRIISLLQEDASLRFIEGQKNKQRPSQKERKTYSNNRREANKKAEQRQQQNQKSFPNNNVDKKNNNFKQK
jgi:hypothetical protein